MGLETICEAEYNGKSGQGKAHLDAKVLTFRGAFRLDIPLKGAKVQAAKGVLHVRCEEGEARFQLGKEAEKWALKIRYPRSLIDKLGVKPDQRVSVLGVEDESFWTDLRLRTADIAEGQLQADCDWIFFAADAVHDLERLSELESRLKRNGSIWVVWRKGQAHLKEDHVREAASAVQLVDVKVVSFSDTHSGLKLMIPKARR